MNVEPADTEGQPYFIFLYLPFTDAPGTCLVHPLGNPALPRKSGKQQKQISATIRVEKLKGKNSP